MIRAFSALLTFSPELRHATTFLDRPPPYRAARFRHAGLAVYDIAHFGCYRNGGGQRNILDHLSTPPAFILKC